MHVRVTRYCAGKCEGEEVLGGRLDRYPPEACFAIQLESVVFSSLGFALLGGGAMGGNSLGSVTFPVRFVSEVDGFSGIFVFLCK